MTAHVSRRLFRIALATLGCALVMALLGVPSVPVRANATVGNGTAASCTFTALAGAIAAGSGTIAFSCGSAPDTILLSSPGLDIPNGSQITIDGSNQITLSGDYVTRVFVVAAGGSLTLKNLSIINGNTVGDGGAIYNNGTLTIDGCTFSGNKAGTGWSGGAIVTYGPLNINNSVFHDNQADNGGAIYPRFAPAVIQITNSTFYSNIASPFLPNGTGWGGAMLLWDGAQVTLNGDNFHDNRARLAGGAIYVQGASLLLASHTQFTSNSAVDYSSEGGAIYSQGNVWTDYTVFQGNTADFGGAIRLDSGTTAILRTLFQKNWAGEGGAIDEGGGTLDGTNSWLTGNGFPPPGKNGTGFGGAIEVISGSSTLANLTISGNNAVFGGGYYQSGTSTVLLQSVTLSGNHADDWGGGILVDSGALTLANVTVYQNSSAAGGGIHLNPASPAIHNTIVANNTGGNCDVPAASPVASLSSDGSCGFGPGRDNVTIRLMNLFNTGGFAPTHLPFADSPAIDNGSNAYCPPTDGRGVTRPQGPACDVGAVERISGEQGPALYLPMVVR